MIVILQAQEGSRNSGHGIPMQVKINSNLIAYKLDTGMYKVIKDRATGRIGSFLTPLNFAKLITLNTDLPLEVLE